MRKRAGRAVWEQRIATCMASGLSCRDWARENGFVYQTVLCWKRKLRENPSNLELGKWKFNNGMF